MKTTLECRDDVLYVVEETDESAQEAKRWLPSAGPNTRRPKSSVVDR